MKKEELQIEMGKLERRNQDLVNEDKRLREQFAKAFSKFEWKNEFGYTRQTKEYEDFSWEQIFVEVGKLVSARTFYDMDGNLSELECKLEQLEKKLTPKD